MGFLRKYIFPILFGVIFFSLFKNHLPKFKVLSALETIDLLKKNDKLSLVRLATVSSTSSPKRGDQTTREPLRASGKRF